jgi:hypothetical protein
MAPHGAMWRHMVPYDGATWRHLAPYGAIWRHVAPGYNLRFSTVIDKNLFKFFILKYADGESVVSRIMTVKTIKIGKNYISNNHL